MKQFITLLLLLVSITVMAQDSTLVEETTTINTVDQFIDKYSPKIEEAFKEIYEFTKVTGQEAVRIFYSYLLLHYVFWTSCSLIACLFFVFMVKTFHKRIANDYDNDNIMLTGLSAMSSLIFAGTFIYWLYYLALILIVPEAAMLLEAMDMMK